MIDISAECAICRHALRKSCRVARWRQGVFDKDVLGQTPRQEHPQGMGGQQGYPAQQSQAQQAMPSQQGYPPQQGGTGEVATGGAGNGTGPRANTSENAANTTAPSRLLKRPVMSNQSSLLCCSTWAWLIFKPDKMRMPAAL